VGEISVGGMVLGYGGRGTFHETSLRVNDWGMGFVMVYEIFEGNCEGHNMLCPYSSWVMSRFSGWAVVQTAGGDIAPPVQIMGWRDERGKAARV